MGASGWQYSVAWQKNVAAALTQWRRDVYDRGAYNREPQGSHGHDDGGGVRATLGLADENDEHYEFLLSEWRRARRRPVPVDPDSLLASQPDSGTHSIIDMADGLSPEPALLTVSPLTPEQMLDFFGTPAPTTEQVERWLADFDPSRIRKRWEGAYLVSHTPDGKPELIHFFGFSGDGQPPAGTRPRRHIGRRRLPHRAALNPVRPSPKGRTGRLANNSGRRLCADVYCQSATSGSGAKASLKPVRS